MSVTPITTPPVQIDPTSIGQFTSTIGPATVGPDLYIALFALANTLQVVKSSDSGATWARVDDGAGSPIAFGGQTAALFTALGIMFVFHGWETGSGINAQFSNEQTFLYSTDLFDPVIEVDNGDALAAAGRSVLRSNGSVLTVLSDVSTASIVGQEFSGGSHGSLFTIAGPFGSPPDVMALALDASDVAHALYLDNDDGLIYYATVDLANSPAGPVVIPDVIQAGTVCLADSGDLYFPYADSGVSYCEVATGATANPADATWSNYQVRATPGGQIDVYPVVHKDGANVLVFFVNEASTGADGTIYYARFNGSGFDAPVVFYDSALYPPVAGLAALPLMSFLSIGSVGGGVVAIVNMQLADFSFPVFYLSSGAVQSGYRNRVY